MTKTILLFALLVLWAGYSHCQDLPKTPAFEVASIKPCPPGTNQPPAEQSGVFQFVLPGGRFNAQAMTLKSLVEWAYRVQPSQHSGGPSWLATDRYDIAAKAEENATEEQMRLMLRTLLAERFQLKFHYETKPISAYVLSVGSKAPKLSLSKEGERHWAQIMPQTGPNQPQTRPDQKVVSYRVTLTRFSLVQLSDLFARQLGGVILNRTGLNGEYNFALELIPDEYRPSPLDPTLLMTAMREQLGLTLKSEKFPLDIMVIDSADKLTADN